MNRGHRDGQEGRSDMSARACQRRGRGLAPCGVEPITAASCPTRTTPAPNQPNHNSQLQLVRHPALVKQQMHLPWTNSRCIPSPLPPSPTPCCDSQLQRVRHPALVKQQLRLGQQRRNVVAAVVLALLCCLELPQRNGGVPLVPAAAAGVRTNRQHRQPVCHYPAVSF